MRTDIRSTFRGGRFLQLLVFCVLLAAMAGPAFATTSYCDSLSNNLLLNCGFELDSSGDHTVIDWTTFNVNVCCDSVENGTVNSGSEAYQFGNPDGSAVVGIAQTFADVSGQTYSVGFVVQYGLSASTTDPSAFLDASIDGTVETSLSGATNPANPFTQFTFTFTGTGSDTIRFDAQTNPSEWLLDDVSVVGPAASGTPEPSTWTLLVCGLAAIHLFNLRKKGSVT